MVVEARLRLHATDDSQQFAGVNLEDIGGHLQRGGQCENLAGRVEVLQGVDDLEGPLSRSFRGRGENAIPDG